MGGGMAEPPDSKREQQQEYDALPINHAPSMFDGATIAVVALAVAVIFITMVVIYIRAPA